jgi:endonuclease/exonuclease/phosphatase family metal-dependent hydrolase
VKKLRVGFVLLIFCILIFYAIHFSLQSKHVWQKSNYFLTADESLIKVVTYNIQFGKGQDGRIDLQRTIDTLKELDADIVSLQEVERYSARSGFQDQVYVIAQALEMNATFYPSLSYPGLYYGNVILSRFPIKESTHLLFNGRNEQRSAILANIQIGEGQTIHVLNTHLGLNKEERARDIERIYGLLQTIDAPIIVTGDLNSTPSKQEYDTWTEDILVKSNQGQVMQTYYDRDWQIDYIFHSSHFVAIETSTLPSDASDHFPVVTILELR